MRIAPATTPVPGNNRGRPTARRLRRRSRLHRRPNGRERRQSAAHPTRRDGSHRRCRRLLLGTIDHGERTTQRNDDQSSPWENGGDWDADTVPIFERDQVVFGKYRLIEKIGEGGMGDVWRVWHVPTWKPSGAEADQAGDR